MSSLNRYFSDDIKCPSRKASWEANLAEEKTDRTEPTPTMFDFVFRIWGKKIWNIKTDTKISFKLRGNFVLARLVSMSRNNLNW